MATLDNDRRAYACKYLIKIHVNTIMTLPASGDISLSQVNTEIGANSTATISMGDSAVRTLFQTPSGDITMNSGHGQNPRMQWFGFTQAYPPVVSSVASDQMIQFYGNSANGAVIPANTITVLVLVVGGGSGGDFRYGVGGGGGGGGGVYYNTHKLEAGVTYSITVGKGGSGSGPDLAGGSGGTSYLTGGSINISVPGGLPSGYSSGRNAGQGQGGGANGGTLPDGAAPYPPPTSNITGVSVYYGGGGGAGGTVGGSANGWGGGNGGASFQQGSPAVNFGAGGGGGGYYTGGTYYYGGDGKSGVVYIRGAFNTGAPVTPLPSYGFTSLPASINEGTAGTIQVVTTYVSTGTNLYWTIGSNSGDFGTSSGSFTIGSSGTGSFTVTPTADLTTEGTERFNIYLRTGSVSGTVVAATADIVINDTSITPVTARFGTYANLVYEGTSVTFPITATGVTPGDNLYWTIDYNASSSSADFSAATGSFAVAGTLASSTGSFTVTAIADQLTEGSETFYVNVRSGSVTGTVLGTAGPITISDTSISPTFSFSFGGGTNLNLRTLAVAAGWQTGQVLTAINTGTIDAYNRSLPALTIDGSFPAGVTFTNNGTIAGGGGTGGRGAAYYNGTYNNGTNGTSGTVAIMIGTNVSIINNGTIGGGGGGGAGGGGHSASPPSHAYYEIYDGGAGGGGAGYGAVGAVGTGVNVPSPYTDWPGEIGGTGGLVTGGYGGAMGGAASDGAPPYTSTAGDGGSLGQPGGTGSTPPSYYAAVVVMQPGQGGAPGAAIAKNGYTVSVTNNGTILGTVG
jgi:hypothetical protein